MNRVFFSFWKSLIKKDTNVNSLTSENYKMDCFKIKNKGTTFKPPANRNVVGAENAHGFPLCPATQ